MNEIADALALAVSGERARGRKEGYNDCLNKVIKIIEDNMAKCIVELKELKNNENTKT